MYRLTIVFAKPSKIYKELILIELLAMPYFLTNSETTFHCLVTTCKIRVSMRSMRKTALKMVSQVS